MKHIKTWQERVEHGSSIYAKASALEIEVDELRTLIEAMEKQTLTDDSSIRGYEVGVNLYRLQSEANKAIARGEGTSWVLLYKANHPTQPVEQPLSDSKDFDFRGRLATLQCWHRLHEREAVELVQFFADATAQPVEQPSIEALVDVAYKHWQDPTTFDLGKVRADFWEVLKVTAEQPSDHPEQGLDMVQPKAEPLTDAQIEALRKKTFSIGNPYCPVDSKSMRKAVRAAEIAHGIQSGAA